MAKIKPKYKMKIPLPLWVPLLRLRHMTPNLKARSARLLVGSTPFSSRKTHSESKLATACLML